MQVITNEEFAMLTICIDKVHDILMTKDFKFEVKQAFNVIEKKTNYIMKSSYGKQSLEELDDYKDAIFKYGYELINGKFEKV